MHSAIQKYFQEYNIKIAPFMHQQFKSWSEEKPLNGLRILHHVPVVANTVLKIACLIAAGAEVVVTNPSSFCAAQPDVIKSLDEAGIRYVEDIKCLKDETFDLYLDCGAELFQALGRPKLGAVELTGSGDAFYRQQSIDFPALSVDRTLTKQLETVFGCAKHCGVALQLLTGGDPAKKSWLIFGFGKIGRGLAYHCRQNNIDFAVVDVDKTQRELAEKLNIKAIDPADLDNLKAAIMQADIVLTATGKESIMDPYEKSWFDGKTLANLGVYDEFGPKFAKKDVLNNKTAINFILKDPTPMEFIDPEFYLHNIAALFFTKYKLKHGVSDVPIALDKKIIEKWCQLHSLSAKDIYTWFIQPSDFREELNLLSSQSLFLSPDFITEKPSVNSSELQPK